MYGYMKHYPEKIPYLCGEGDPLGTASWVRMPQSEYARLKRFERAEVEEAFFTLRAELPEAPERAELRISAVNRYRLFVNGVSCAFGPRKGDQYSQYYDTVDVAPLLRPGENLLAVYVVSATAKATQVGQRKALSATSIASVLDVIGLIVNLRAGGVDLSTGVADWRVRMDDSKTHHFYEPCDLLGTFERVELDRVPGDWRTDPRVSADWTPAEVLFKAGINYYGQMRGLPLMPRPFAMMEETPAAFARQIAPHDTRPFSFDGDGRCVLPPHTRAAVILDAGTNTTAFVAVAMAGKGAVVRMTYAEAFMLREAPEGCGEAFMLADEQGPLYKWRRDDENGVIAGAWDEVVAGSAEAVYEPFWFRAFRFIRVDVETGDAPLALSMPAMRRVRYPLEVRTRVDSSDANALWLWETSLRTLRNCLHEDFDSDSYYEQLQYVMDTKLMMDFVYALSPDTDFAAATLWDFHCSLRPDGMISCSYPSNEVQIIPGFSLQFIWMLERYYHHTGDRPMAAFYRPTMDAILAYFERHLNDDGLCEGLGYWEFGDWSNAWNGCHGRPNAILHGPSTLFNLMYALSLQMAAKLNRATGREGMAREYEGRADAVKAAVRRRCFVAARGMLCEAPGFMEFSQHAQVLAVLTGLFSGDEGRAALEHTFEPDVIECSLPWRYYLFRALERYDLYDRMWERLDSFARLRQFNLTTMPEWSLDGPRSDCHPWSCGPLYEMTATVLGVRGDGDGWERISVRPRPLAYDDFRGEVVTPRGMVDVDWRIDDGRMKLALTTPWDTIVEMPDGRKYPVQAGQYAFEALVPEHMRVRR